MEKKATSNFLAMAVKNLTADNTLHESHLAELKIAHRLIDCITSREVKNSIKARTNSAKVMMFKLEYDAMAKEWVDGIFTANFSVDKFCSVSIAWFAQPELAPSSLNSIPKNQALSLAIVGVALKELGSRQGGAHVVIY